MKPTQKGPPASPAAAQKIRNAKAAALRSTKQPAPAKPKYEEEGSAPPMPKGF